MSKELDYIALGARIRKAREAKGLTQERLSELCILSTAYIGNLERGTRIPSLETLHKISRILQTGIGTLLFDSIRTEDDLLLHIHAMLPDKDKTKVKNFLCAVRALADKIDEL